MERLSLGPWKNFFIKIQKPQIAKEKIRKFEYTVNFSLSLSLSLKYYIMKKNF